MKDIIRERIREKLMERNPNSFSHLLKKTVKKKEFELKWDDEVGSAQLITGQLKVGPNKGKWVAEVQSFDFDKSLGLRKNRVFDTEQDVMKAFDYVDGKVDYDKLTKDFTDKR